MDLWNTFARRETLNKGGFQILRKYCINHRRNNIIELREEKHYYVPGTAKSGKKSGCGLFQYTFARKGHT
jgi:hypothetical protein